MIDQKTLRRIIGILVAPFLRWRVIAAAFASIGLIHIASTFAMPHLSSGTAYDRLKPQLPKNQMLYLPALTPENQPLAFMSADSLYAMCLFDSRKSPVFVKAHLPTSGWTLSLYSETGANFYSAAGRDDRPVDLDLKIVPSSERFSGLSPEALGVASPETRQQTLEKPRGLAVVRAPDRGLAYGRDAEIKIEKSICYAEPS